MQHPSNYKVASMGTDKEGTGRLDDIFMVLVPVEHSRVPRSHTADSRTHVSHGKTTISDKDKKVPGLKTKMSK